MWQLKKVYYRIVQAIMRTGINFLKYKNAELVEEPGSIMKMADILKHENLNNVLIIVSRTLLKSGALEDSLKRLKEKNISYEIYDSVKPNPSIENIEECLKVYEQKKCSGIVAIGGGSPIDCAKVVGARAANKNHTIKDLRGFLKVRNRPPKLIAIPTTAGSGSEVTVAAVVTDSVTHEKYAIADPKLIPDYVILDANLTVGVPKPLTAATGMDALTHAVEAYVGKSGTVFTDKRALEAVKMIINNLETVYKDGNNIEGRKAMLLASCYAGEAFTRANVGYVHAIAHSIGGLYGVAHGLANAIILPGILEYYGESAYRKLAELAIYSGLGKEDESKEVLAKKFITQIKNMNKNMNIPNKISEIKPEDIELIAQRATKEANPNYPVPKIMSTNECKKIVTALLD